MREAGAKKAVGVRGKAEQKNRGKTEQKALLHVAVPAFLQALCQACFSDFRHIPAPFRRESNIKTVYHRAGKKTREALDFSGFPVIG